ncbi:MAG: T9SS type A sorting domain-containing protein [Bacteroidia bacterium]|jgi:hypothetical protein
MRTKFLWGFILIWICVVQSTAQTIRVRMPDTTGITGTVMEYPIYVDSSVSGKNVLAYQFKINVYNNPVSFLGIVTTGTMSAGFATPTYSVNTASGQITISAAGANALTGTGVLFYLQMKLNTAGNYFTYFNGSSTCFFNQGLPALNLDDGNLIVTNPPSIQAYFNNNNPITIGDSTRVFVNGGIPPYTFQVLNPVVASITSTGMLHALAVGKTAVRVQSSNGIVDTTDAIEIRALKLILPDTTVLPLANILYPIRINNTTALGVISGSMRINFYAPNAVPDSVILTNTLLQNYIVNYKVYSNYIHITFAGVNPLVGQGDLLKIRFRVLNPIGFNITTQDIVFNQSIQVNPGNGWLYFYSINALTINPLYGNYFTGQTQQFTANGGRAPYQFSVSDTSSGSINALGIFTARKGGKVRVIVKDSLNAIVQSDPLQIFDASIELPEVSVLKGSWITYPVFIANLTGQRNLNSIQFTIQFTQGALDSIQITNANSVSSNWSVTQHVQGNKIIVAMAGVNPIQTNGILLRIQMKLDTGLNPGSGVYFQLSDLLFNEGDFFGKPQNGQLNIVAALQKDLGISSIPGSWNTCPKQIRDTVSAVIYNYDNVTFYPGDTALVGYQLNNGPVSMDTIVFTANLSKNNSLYYRFKQTVVLDTPGMFNLRVFVHVLGDVYANNDTNAIQFQVFSNPVVNLGPDTSFCYGATIFLDATVPNGNYFWSNQEMGSAISVDTSGLFWVRVTSPGGCFAIDTIVVTAVLPPDPILIALSAYGNSCGTDSVKLSIPLTNGNQYRWYFNGTITMNNADTMHEYIALQSGTYSVRVTNASGCFTFMPDTIINLFNIQQDAPEIQLHPALCEGDTLKLTASFLANITYRWNGPGGYSDTGQQISRGAATMLMNGIYSLYAIKWGATGACDTSFTNSTEVIIYPRPAKIALGVSGNLSFCIGDSVVLSTPANLFRKYLWYKNGTPVSLNDTMNSFAARTSGVYTVLVTDTNACANLMRDTSVVLNPKPVTSVITGNANVFVNSVQTYSVTNTAGSVYFWIIYNGIQSGGFTTNSISVTWGNSPDYGGVRVVERSAAGCLGDTVSKLITVNPLPDSLRLSVDTLYYTAAGGGQNVSVTSNRSWTVNNPVTWAGVNPMSGSGNATLFVSLNANPSSIARQATITVQAGTVTRNLTVKQAGTTGLQEMGKATWLQVYPNPSNGEFTIENKVGHSYKAIITNLAGNTIGQLQIDANSRNELHFPELPCGVYILQLHNAGENWFMKFIVVR